MHVLDLAPLDGSDPALNYDTVEAELQEHGQGLADPPRIAPRRPTSSPRARARGCRGLEAPPGPVPGAVLDVVATSAATGEGLDELAAAIFQNVLESPPRTRCRPPPPPIGCTAPVAPTPFRIDKRPSGAFRVEGQRVERLIARHDVDNEESLRYIEEGCARSA